MEKILLFLFRCQVRGLTVFYLSSSLPLPGLQARTDSHPAKIYENVFFYTHKNHTHLSFLRNDILLDVAAAPHERGQGVQLQRADPRCHDWSILCASLCTRKQLLICFCSRCLGACMCSSCHVFTPVADKVKCEAFVRL